MSKKYHVYILTNKTRKVLYVGMTNDLKRRVYEHKRGTGSKFTSRYNVNRLVYYEEFDDFYNAMRREKQIKGGSRERKEELVETMNKEWKDLVTTWE